jgi:4,5-dihydroxyphthalate decarboxylase
MTDLRLRTLTRTSGANAALKDGSVTPHGAALEFVEIPVLVQGFRRMVRNLEFDVSEMALTTYVVAKAHGVRFTALPVILVRGFHHGAIQVARNGDISAPKQLEGRRVGVNRGYTVTTGVWARGILADEYGVDLDRVSWVLSGDEHVALYRPPANVTPMPKGGDLGHMLTAGALAATVGVDSTDPEVVPLIAAPEQAALEALRRTGLFPINHLVVVRDDLLAEHPGLAADLFHTFAEAKNRYVARLREHSVAEPTGADRTYMRVMEVTGQDPLPYGVEPNRATLEKLLDHAVAQHIVDRRPALESLFAESTLGLTA